MTGNPPRALHLPDLPEVSVQLGSASAPDGLDPVPPGGAPRTAPGWGYRLRQGVLSYLPLLLMGLLAASTGWLVKNTPQGPVPTLPGPPRQTPDYTMTGFAVTRYAPDGREALRIAGDVMRHFPATDQMEIEGVRIRAYAPDGRITDATARRALSNADGSEVQLLGGARVLSQVPGAEPLEITGEFLHAFVRFEQLRSHLPVRVRRGDSDVRAGGLVYDHLDQQLQLLGPVRMTITPGRTGSTAP